MTSATPIYDELIFAQIAEDFEIPCDMTIFDTHTMTPVSTCPEPARWIMRPAMSCSCASRACLLCDDHKDHFITWNGSRLLKCLVCGAQASIGSIEPLDKKCM